MIGPSTKCPLGVSIAWFESKPRAVQIKVIANTNLQEGLANEIGIDPKKERSIDCFYSLSKKKPEATSQLNEALAFRADSFIEKISVSFFLDQGGPGVFEKFFHGDNNNTLPSGITSFLQVFREKLNAISFRENNLFENFSIFLNRTSSSQQERLNYLKDRVYLNFLNGLKNSEKIKIFETLVTADNSSLSSPGLPSVQLEVNDLKTHYLERVNEARKTQKSSPSSNWR